MRKKIVAGNWKMNTLKNEAEALVNEVLNLLSEIDLSEDKNVIFSSPSLYLDKVSQAIENNDFVYSCSQNIYFEKSGAYTGELSADMVKSVGVDYTLIGHSERRAHFNETNVILSKKVAAAIATKLIPIYCCGEQLEDRKSENHFKIIQTQIEEGLYHLTAVEFENVVIAYEPVWAIGTGETATSAQAQEMHAFIRGIIAKQFGEKIADKITILYGGSCKPSNAKELFSCADVDGGLIGGASLVAEDFISIVKSL